MSIKKMKEKGSIAIIPIKGMITSEESVFGLMAASTVIIKDIEEAEIKRKGLLRRVMEEMMR
jgi:hypothetical protein